MRPVGQGSGICAAIAARNALGLATRIIGVVSAHAPAYKLSFEQGRSIEAPVTTQIADGMACRVPDEAALEIMLKYVDRMVAVSDDEVAAAMTMKEALSHRKIGLTLSGGNVDRDVFAGILSTDS